MTEQELKEVFETLHNPDDMPAFNLFEAGHDARQKDIDLLNIQLESAANISTLKDKALDRAWKRITELEKNLLNEMDRHFETAGVMKIRTEECDGHKKRIAELEIKAARYDYIKKESFRQRLDEQSGYCSEYQLPYFPASSGIGDPAKWDTNSLDEAIDRAIVKGGV